MLKMPKETRQRLQKELIRFQGIMQKASDRVVSQAGTLTLLQDMLVTVFGYERNTEITTQEAIKGTNFDLTVKVDGKIKFLIKVMPVGAPLKHNQIREALGYWSREGFKPVVLTNGLDWRIHRVVYEQPLNTELIRTFNISDLNPQTEEDLQHLYCLSKEGFDEFQPTIHEARKKVSGPVERESLPASKNPNALVNRLGSILEQNRKHTSADIEKFQQENLKTEALAEAEAKGETEQPIETGTEETEAEEKNANEKNNKKTNGFSPK